MNTNDNETYNPADDDNQGVVQLLAQGEEANKGIAQVERMNPVTDSGPEPEKAEIADPDGDYSINDDELAEEDVENGTVELTNEDSTDE